MENCCSLSIEKSKNIVCPSCKNPGKQMKVITLKSLLHPNALVRLEPETMYYFCSLPKCDIVYFNDQEQAFSKNDVKAPVFQKDKQESVQICYCFDWTRKRIYEEIKETGKSTAVQNITIHIKAKRCGCEVNNPQGSCCLGNVSEFIREIKGLE